MGSPFFPVCSTLSSSFILKSYKQKSIHEVKEEKSETRQGKNKQSECDKTPSNREPSGLE